MFVGEKGNDAVASSGQRKKILKLFENLFYFCFHFVLRCLRTGFESVMDSFGPACVMFEKNEEKKCDMEKNFSNQCLPNVQITV